MSPDLVAFAPPNHTPPEPTAPTPSPAITMSHVKPRPLEWLWPGWLALGKLAVVDADPEQGKSFVLLDLAARLSRGAPMPDEGQGETESEERVAGAESSKPRLAASPNRGIAAPCPGHPYPNGCHAFAADAAPAPLIARPPGAKACHPRPPVDVTMLIAEDSLEDTVFPRLEAAGADLSRIHILKSIPVGQTFLSAKATKADRNVCPTLRLPRDLPLVEQIIQQTQSRLLVIDPSLADLDPHCLHQLADLADRLRCTVVIQRYLNKLAGTRAICRGGGSMSVIGTARTAMLIARDPREEAMRILASTKNNFGPRPASLRFVLEPVSPGVCRVNWLGPSPLGADDLLAIQFATEAKSAIAEAMKFLKGFLQDGPKATEMCYEEAKNNQIAERTLRRAKLRLGVVSNEPRTLLGLFLPATWELQTRSEYQPPHSLANGPTDDDLNHKPHEYKEIN